MYIKDKTQKITLSDGNTQGSFTQLEEPEASIS